MNKKFSMNDLTVIKGYEPLTNNQLDEIKGGAEPIKHDCSCVSMNTNNCSVINTGSCKCDFGNTNSAGT